MGPLSSRDGSRRGMTLLEVIVALAASGLLLSGASAAFLGLSGRAERLERVRTEADHRANAERVLRLLAGNFRISGDSLALEGDEQRAAFPSWCDAPGTRLAPCLVTLGIDRSSAKAALVLEAEEVDGTRDSMWLTLELWSAGTVGLRYLLDPAAGGTWTDTWSEDIPPWAVGIISDADTLILPLGVR